MVKNLLLGPFYHQRTLIDNSLNRMRSGWFCYCGQNGVKRSRSQPDKMLF